jgi:hemerythrin-like domain-containing protein
MSYYPIQLDKVRNFKYGMRALSLVEKKFKKPINKVDMDNMTMEDTATLIWAGLVHEDKNLTPDKVMDLIDEHSSLPEVMRQLTEAMNESFGAGAVEEEGAGKNE